ncbi:MAG: O-antigen ligase family protein [Anaerolineales bacterium]
MIEAATKTQLKDIAVRYLLHRNVGVRMLAVAVLALIVGGPIGILVGLLGPVVGAAAVIAIVAVYAVFRSPLLALLSVMAVAFVLPFAAVPVDIGFAPTFLDLTLVAAFVVWISRTVLHKDREIILEWPFGGVLVFATLAVFSFIVGLSHAPLSSTILRRFAELLLAILSFVLVLNIVRTRQQLVIAAHAMVCGGFMAGLAGVGIYFLPRDLAQRVLNALSALRYPSGDVLRYIEDDPEQALRAIGTSVDPNVLGGVLIFTAVLGTALLLCKEPILPRWLLAVMVGTMVICLYLTYSRSAFVGLAVGIALLGVFRYPKLIWWGLAGALLMLLLPQTQDYVQRFIGGLRGEDLAMQMRFGEYKDALIVIRRHPWIGVGFSGTPEIDTYIGVSSVYLLIGEEMGLIGLTAFVATMGAFFVRFLARRHVLAQDSLLQAIGYGTTMAVAGALVAGLADHYLFNLVFPHAGVILWSTMALGVASLRIAVLPERRITPDRRHWIVQAFLPDPPPQRRAADVPTP